MMRIQEIKLPIEHGKDALIEAVCKRLHIDRERIRSLNIVRRSVDARKKPALFFVYIVDVAVQGERSILADRRHKNIMKTNERVYRFPDGGAEPLIAPPVIVGSGPAGLFCASALAEAGYRPIVLERGACADERVLNVRRFWAGEGLDPNTNVQFGEGGAGTFSDGKLATSVRDRAGRVAEVLRRFVEAGANPAILYEAKPHLGTDQLVRIVQTMRKRIESLGGSVRFLTKLQSIETEDGKLRALLLSDGSCIETDLLVLATGHAARDTYRSLFDAGLYMEPKSFAVGLRVEHPQELIDRAQYGMAAPEILGAAAYSLSTRMPSGRAVYSFCMCPGGHVINASSEADGTVVNGMSLSTRDSGVANSAVIVSVTPADFRSFAEAELPDALQGIAFQRALEQRAFHLAEGRIPSQRFADFEEALGRTSDSPLAACHRGESAFVDLRGLLPKEIEADFIGGMRAFDQKIHGFAGGEALLSGVESRTSAPVRITRDERLESNIRGIYPCGEGAGYAGGITSAALDGLRVAEAIASRYKKFTCD